MKKRANTFISTLFLNLMSWCLLLSFINLKNMRNFLSTNQSTITYY